MKLVFATHNRHKLAEIQSLLEGKIDLLSLWEIDCQDDIKETETTLEGNALIKARYIKEHYGYDCFADDTGLEVVTLGGRPGVYSARYAGENCLPEDNINKLLQELQYTENRQAQFRTVIALILDGKEYLFEGKVEGEITKERAGEKGFGYDPVFRRLGDSRTFAQLSQQEKGKIGHRGMAVKELVNFLLG